MFITPFKWPVWWKPSSDKYTMWYGSFFFLNEIIHWYNVIVALKIKGKANSLLSAWSLHYFYEEPFLVWNIDIDRRKKMVSTPGLSTLKGYFSRFHKLRFSKLEKMKLPLSAKCYGIHHWHGMLAVSFPYSNTCYHLIKVKFWGHMMTTELICGEKL